MMDQSFIKEIEAFADKGALILGEPLCSHTTFRVGGKADAFLSVRNEEQLKKAVLLCKDYGVPFLILGNGSNLLVSDDGYRGMVILIGKSTNIYYMVMNKSSAIRHTMLRQLLDKNEGLFKTLDIQIEE